MENPIQTSWDIVEKPLYYVDARHQMSTVPRRKAIVRDDDGRVLNVVSQGYRPVTNARLRDLARAIGGQCGYVLEQESSYSHGARMLIHLRAASPLVIDGHQFKDYMVVGNAHDGTSGVFVGSTQVMVRCSNQFSRIARNARIRHTGDVEAALGVVEAAWAAYAAERDALRRMMEDFSSIRFGREQIAVLAKRLAGTSETGGKDASAKRRAMEARLTEAIEKETFELGQTAFGALQGVTFYTTHMLPKTHFGNLFGKGARVNAEAARLLLETA